MRTTGNHLPDPKNARGPYRPFTSDPSLKEAWWWLGFPVVLAAFTISSYWLAPDWYRRYVLPEGYGILELSHVLIPLLGFLIAVRLLFLRFVRARPFVFIVAFIGALSSFYIAGEEMSWGQHFFHWDTPEYWAKVNRQQETNLHNSYGIFEKTPSLILDIVVYAGGLIVPIFAPFFPWLRANRMALFLPAAALVPTALGVVIFVIADELYKGGMVGRLVQRPSETVETYLYFFILAYLIVYSRRIRELEQRGGPIGDRLDARTPQLGLDGGKNVGSAPPPPAPNYP